MTVNLVRFVVSPNMQYSGMRDVIPLWDVEPDFVWRWCFVDAVQKSEIVWPGAGQAQCQSEDDVPATEQRLREITDQVNAQVPLLSAEHLKILRETEAHGIHTAAIAHEPDGAIQVIRWV